MRENGYYWIRYVEEWTVAFWWFDHWQLVNTEGEYYDENFEEIGDKVERKEKQFVTLQNKRYPKLGGKVYVTIVDSETGEEETVMAGNIVKIESTDRGLDTLTVKQGMPSNLSETGV